MNLDGSGDPSLVLYSPSNIKHIAIVEWLAVFPCAGHRRTHQIAEHHSNVRYEQSDYGVL